jgi:AcrR family transcriptional regulator
MAAQARAEATRQSIVDAAVSLFGELGYSGTDVIDIIDRAEVTKGAFHYHFKTKQAVAEAIIEEADARTEEAYLRLKTPSSLALEDLVQASFIAAYVTEQDRQVRIGNLLRQALAQADSRDSAPYVRRRAAFVDAIADAAGEGDLIGGADPEAVGHTLWVSTLGAGLMAEVTGDDIFAQLAQVWRIVLTGFVAPNSLARITQFIDGMALQYGGSS